MLIADDHTILREGLQLLIESQADLEVVGQANSIHTLLREAERLNPDVICLDLNFPDGRGIKAIARLRGVCPRVKILIVTAHDETACLHAAVAEGVNGYVVKSVPAAELLSAIRAVHHHRMVVRLDSADDTKLDSSPRSSSSGKNFSGLGCLSPRERQVLQLLAFGYTNQQAADRLFLSVKTVETHRARILAKLGMRDRVDLIRYAIELGLFPTGKESTVNQPQAKILSVNTED